MRERPVTAATASTREAERRLARLGRWLAGRSDEIVVGPWTAEVGFELLYWIPFLRWFVARHELAPSRILVVSRGGTASWYEGVADRYVEIFDVFSPAEFHAAMEARWSQAGMRKQVAFDAWDERLLRRTGVDVAPDNIVHPALVNDLFREYWRGREPLAYVLSRMRHERRRRPADDSLELPREPFAAVRFYTSAVFPDDATARRLAGRIVTRLATSMPVVLLDTGLRLDDHDDVGADGTRVTAPLRGVAPGRNLHLQSVAISRAQVFAGTYGGLAYLAPSYGGASIAFASGHRSHKTAHLDLARAAARAAGGSLTVLDEGAAAIVERLAAGAA